MLPRLRKRREEEEGPPAPSVTPGQHRLQAAAAPAIFLPPHRPRETPLRSLPGACCTVLQVPPGRPVRSNERPWEMDRAQAAREQKQETGSEEVS